MKDGDIFTRTKPASIRDLYYNSDGETSYDEQYLQDKHEIYVRCHKRVQKKLRDITLKGMSIDCPAGKVDKMMEAV